MRKNGSIIAALILMDFLPCILFYAMLSLLFSTGTPALILYLTLGFATPISFGAAVTIHRAYRDRAQWNVFTRLLSLLGQWLSVFVAIGAIYCLYVFFRYAI